LPFGTRGRSIVVAGRALPARRAQPPGDQLLRQRPLDLQAVPRRRSQPVQLLAPLRLPLPVGAPAASPPCPLASPALAAFTRRTGGRRPLRRGGGTPAPGGGRGR